MNIAAEHLPAERIFSPRQVREARAIAAQAGRSAVEVLEEQSGLDAEDFVAALGRMLGYPVFGMDDLNGLAHAFDTLSFAEALERDCLALREHDGRLLVIMSDPFDAGLQTWVEHRIAADFGWGLAHRADIATYLAHYEESLHAMDSVQTVAEKTATFDEDVEELSFRTISEDVSPVVKLVHSTVYDALKAEASDIHLETSVSGLNIKYRIDGVLTAVGSVAGLDLAEQVISRIKIISGLDIA